MMFSFSQMKWKKLVNIPLSILSLNLHSPFPSPVTQWYRTYQIYMTKFMFQFAEQHYIKFLAKVHWVREAWLLEEPVEHLSDVSSTIVQSQLSVYRREAYMIQGFQECIYGPSDRYAKILHHEKQTHSWQIKFSPLQFWQICVEES